MTHIMTHVELRCIVNEAIHENSVIDLILTDEEFNTCSQSNPVTDRTPTTAVIRGPDAPSVPSPHSVFTYKPFFDSSVRQFGHDREDGLRAEGVDKAADELERTLVERYEAAFQDQHQRMLKDKKPWITALILRLMNARRRSYDRGRMYRWRTIHTQVK